jgi:D-3-phosphoglycerate dehydrogenase
MSVKEMPVNSVADTKLKPVGDVVRIDARDEHLEEKVSDADAILIRLGKISPALIQSAKKLKIIATQGVGVDFIDIDAVEKSAIVLTTAPVANVSSVAEHTMCLMLALARRVFEISEKVKQGKWIQARDEIEAEPMKLLLGKTLGIVGLGNVGTRVAKRAAAFEMNLVAYDPYIPAERFQEVGAASVDLETLLRKSDIVVLHVPLTSLTRHMIGEKQLRLMKRDALLINTARGPLIDEQALYKALKAGIIKGAALDVREKEPSGADDPLSTLQNIILTPHMAGSSDFTLLRMSETAAEEIIRVLRGEKPLHPYVRQALPYPL